MPRQYVWRGGERKKRNSHRDGTGYRYRMLRVKEEEETAEENSGRAIKGDLFIRASTSAERSRKVKTEKRPHIWEIRVGNNEEKKSNYAQNNVLNKAGNCIVKFKEFNLELIFKMYKVSNTNSPL